MKLYFSVLALAVPAAAFTMHKPVGLAQQSRFHAYSSEDGQSPETIQSVPTTYGGGQMPGLATMPSEEERKKSSQNPLIPFQRRALDYTMPQVPQSSNVATLRNRGILDGGVLPNSSQPREGGVNLSDKALEMDNGMLKVQGNSLKTWAFQTPEINRVHIVMKTEGRPLNANVDLWQGPDNAPQRMKIYIEDGANRPFNAILQTPGGQNSVAIRNTNSMEFPFVARIDAEIDGTVNIGLKEDMDSLKDNAIGRVVQGGAVFTKPFAAEVQSVQIMCTTDGRPLSARIELLQGPNNIKQVLDVYCEDGFVRPFFIIIETPDPGCVVRIVNTATMEYPLKAIVEPYTIDDSPNPKGVTSFFIVD